MAGQYTAAVVGTGSGGRLSMRALTASQRFQLVAAADLSEAARHALDADFSGLRTFATHGEMFRDCRPDVVCVSTWPPSHLEVTSDALDLPLKGILVEKPLADNWADGRQILNLVRAKGLPLAVPHGLLVAEHARQILDRVREGQIGDLELVEIQCTGWDIINAGIHWLSYALELLQGERMEWVMACCDSSSRTYRDGMQVETLAVTNLQTYGGTRVVMYTGDYVRVSREGKGTLFRLIGTRGMLEFYAWEPSFWMLNQAHPQGRLIQVETGPRSGHQRHLEALADQMDLGQPDYAIAESSLAALELCEAAYLSVRYRCTVRLPLSEFAAPGPSDWEPGRPYTGQGGGRNGRSLPPQG